MRLAATDIIDAMQGIIVALIPKLGGSSQLNKLSQGSTSDGGGGASMFQVFGYKEES